VCGLERKTKVGMHGMIDKDSVGFGKKNKSWHAWNDGQRTVYGLKRKTKVGIEPKPHALDVNENKTRTTSLVRGVEK
jgi:hypothetical protein